MSEKVPTSARVLGAIGRGLITAGVVVLLFVAFQLWGTNIQEARAQDDLRGDFDQSFEAAQEQLATLIASDPMEVIDAGTTDGEPSDLPTPVPTSTLPGGFDPALLAFFFPEDGDATARIEIPAIGIEKIVVSGVQVVDLRKGPGHYPDTAAVGTAGNTSIAGHRTTYGAPFNRIDELQPGDEIHVTGILGRFTYRVLDPQSAFPDQLDMVVGQGAGHIIVKPSATWVLGDFGDNRITLTACHPKLSSRQRIIVAAELVEEAVEAPQFDPEIVAQYLGENSEASNSLGADESSEPGEDAISAEASDTADLDTGLQGDRGAIPGATLWMIGATFFWVIAGVVGRRYFEDRWRRVAVRFVGLAPAAVCLWYSFEMIDRALPAG